MGGNGSSATGATESEAGRLWKTIDVIGNIHILQKKNINDSNKLPEESHTPNRIYATFNTDGSDVKSIAQYDAECKKIWEIHTTDHDDKHEHYHPWDNGHPIQYWDTIKQKNRNVTIDLTSEMEKILLKLRNYGT
jgi:hypothetical protein